MEADALFHLYSQEVHKENGKEIYKEQIQK